MAHDTSTILFPKTRPHYELLDGLRGVAAFMVIWYHIFEGFATSPIDQKFNHGYLAVDFFFVLSGFVIGYAYDDRWQNGLTSKDFILRRIVRLQPMVVLGVVLGVLSFCIQGAVKWDGTHVSVTAIVLSLLLGLFMIPAVPGTLPEVRGYGEMFPLNGPSWSLFFEYIGSILYAIILHRLSTKALKSVAVTSGIALALMATLNMSGTYHLGVGWSLSEYGFFGGFIRMIFSFSIGLLMSRHFKPIKIRGAFWICSSIIIGLFCVPYIGNEASVTNGLFDAICTIAIFPVIIYLGASGKTTDAISNKICSFLGNISYPVYIIHYPFMYLFYAWVWKNNYTFDQIWPVAALLVISVIALAYAALKLYDQPVRKLLTARIFAKSVKNMH